MILYEDNHLLALNKPAGLVTQPSPTSSNSLEEIGKTVIKTKFLEAVHRLDKPVSGIVLFAKTRKALSRMQKAIREKNVRKSYLAKVSGTPPKRATLEHYLLKGDYKTTIVKAGTEGAKRALLHLKSRGHLVEIELVTGRYHQIRAQLAYIGCPIEGDIKYGSLKNLQNGMIALHHHKLQFTHPVTDETLLIEAPLPNFCRNL